MSAPPAVFLKGGGSGAGDGRPEVLVSAGQIAARLDDLAEEIAAHPALVGQRSEPRPGAGRGGNGREGDGPLALCALRGAFIFAADILRALSHHGVDPEVSFLRIASYGDATSPQHEPRLIQDLDCDVSGRTVLIIDDILDTGETLTFLHRLLKERGAAQIVSVVLLDKAARRRMPVEADFVGFQCPNVFVVGYGMDAGERYRNLPYVGVLETTG